MRNELFVNLPQKDESSSTSLFVITHRIEDTAQTRPTLILLPGGPGNDHTMYDVPGFSFVEALLPYTDIILFDPRGCGKSAKAPIEECNLHGYIEDVESLRQYFHITPNQFYVLGVSYGAIAALGYAINYSQSLAKLILLCGAVNKNFITEAIDNLKIIGSSEQQYEGSKALEGKLANDPKQYENYYRAMGPLYSLKYQIDSPTPPLTNMPLTNYGFSNFLRKFDYTKNLQQVHCPTLILAGAEDWLTTPLQAKLIHDGIANSKLIIYKNCRHLIWVDQWEQSIRDIKSFI